MIKVGQFAEITRRFSREDLEEFSTLIGTTTAAPDTVPEPLIGALFSHLLGVRLPGPGTNYLKQEMRFFRSAPLDTDLTARVTISRFRADKHLVDLWATCKTPDGNLICEGRSLVLARDVA